MRRYRALTRRVLSATALLIVAISSRHAKADLTIYDQNGWSFYTKGLIAAQYQLVMGDGDPAGINGRELSGGKFLTSNSQDGRGATPTVTLSRMRSGFVGTQIGFGVNRKINDSIHVDSLMAVSLNDISSDRGQTRSRVSTSAKPGASIVTPYGSLKFGRMFSIFGSASADVVLIAYRYGLGNPCTLAVPGVIGCGSVGAGPLYAGFDAQMRYISPRLGGFELQFAVVDPTRSSTDFTLTPQPRFDAELNYDNAFGPAHVRVVAQGLSDLAEKVNGPDLQKLHVWGVMGTGIIDVAGLTVGGGGWTGSAIGTHVPFEVEDPTYPLSYDEQTGEGRLFRGFFGNVAYDYRGTALAVGAGTVFVRPTATDKGATVAYSVLTQNEEWHAVLTHKIDTVVFSAEYMHWTSKWYFGEKQNLNFGGVGVNYFW